MPKRDLLHEWMHRFDMGSGVVLRVWAKAESEHVAELNEQRKALDRIIASDGGRGFSLLREISAQPFVNAAELLNAAGNGRLVYVDWP